MKKSGIGFFADSECGPSEDEEPQDDDMSGSDATVDNSDDDNSIVYSEPDEAMNDTSAVVNREELKESAKELEKKVRKSGVIYLSTIPPGMNVAKLREILGHYGDIGRIFLEVDSRGAPQKKRTENSGKHGQKYVEGWVEFASKKVARMVAESLNNQPVGGKRRAPYYESLWNVKYLHRFKWSHLTERLSHQRTVHKHRLRQEVAQAKRQTNFYAQNIEKSRMLHKLKARKSKEGKEFAPLKTFVIPQASTDQEITERKSEFKTLRRSGQGSMDKSMLQKLFPAK